MERRIYIGLVFLSVLWMCICGSGCGNSGSNGQQKEHTSAGEEHTGALENGKGTSSSASIEGAYYYDLLEDGDGNLFAFTDNASKGVGKDAPVIAWKSQDRGNTWEELLYQPEAVRDGSELLAGALRIGEEGIEAFAAFAEHEDEAEDAYAYRLYKMTENACEELEAGEAFAQLGDGALWNISFVNGHIISLAGEKQCVLYDIEEKKAVKSLSYDPFSVAFLPMQEQFFVYGKELAYCLDAETLEEQEAEKSLQEFIAAMYEKTIALCSRLWTCIRILSYAPQQRQFTNIGRERPYRLCLSRT